MRHYPHVKLQLQIRLNELCDYVSQKNLRTADRLCNIPFSQLRSVVHQCRNPIMAEVGFPQPKHDFACFNSTNGFYGPGTMLGWYLTLAGCIVSWTLHPERKRKDSITTDTVVFLAFPLLAAVHMVLLSRCISGTYTTIEIDETVSRSISLEKLASLYSCQSRLTIEPPAKVVFAYINIVIVVISPLSATHCLKRGLAIYFVVLVSLASEYYIHAVALYNTPEFILPHTFLSQRYLLAPVASTVFACDMAELTVGRFFSHRPKKCEQLEDPPPLETDAETARRDDVEYLEPPWASRLGMILLSIVGYLLRNTNLGWIAPPMIHFWTIDWVTLFFIESLYRIADVEQVTAAATGAIVFASSLYSALAAFYQ